RPHGRLRPDHTDLFGIPTKFSRCLVFWPISRPPGVGAALAVHGVGVCCRTYPWRQRPMGVMRVGRAQVLRAARCVMAAAAIFAVPELCRAQDDRPDDPLRPPSRDQTGTPVGATGAATPAAIGTTGVTPSGTGTNVPPITATTTPTTGLFKEPA